MSTFTYQVLRISTQRFTHDIAPLSKNVPNLQIVGRINRKLHNLSKGPITQTTCKILLTGKYKIFQPTSSLHVPHAVGPN